MNNLISPEANAKPAEIANALYVAITQHQAYHDAVVHVVDLLHPLNLRTLQFLRAKFKEPNMRYQSQKGPDFAQGEAYAFKRIDEFLANAIELAGGEPVKPEPTPKQEPEIQWDKLPEWANWAAMDKNGVWYGYEGKPEKNNMQWTLTGVGRLVCIKIEQINTVINWGQSLVQRPKTTEQ